MQATQINAQVTKELISFLNPVIESLSHLIYLNPSHLSSPALWDSSLSCFFLEIFELLLQSLFSSSAFSSRLCMLCNIRLTLSLFPVCILSRFPRWSYLALLVQMKIYADVSLPKIVSLDPVSLSLEDKVSIVCSPTPVINVWNSP